MSEPDLESLPWLRGSYRFPLHSWESSPDDVRDVCAARLRTKAREDQHEPRGPVAYKAPRIEGQEVVIVCGVQIVVDGLLPRIERGALESLLIEAEIITGKDLRGKR